MKSFCALLASTVLLGALCGCSSAESVSNESNAAGTTAEETAGEEPASDDGTSGTTLPDDTDNIGTTGDSEAESDTDETDGEGTVPRQTIDEFGLSFQAPDGLSAGEFTYYEGMDGGVLLNDPGDAQTKTEDDGTQPAAWITAAGFIGEVHNELLAFDADGNPVQLHAMINHITIQEGPDQVSETVEPALLYRIDVNKYTIGYLTEHPELQEEEQDAHRWFVFMADSPEADVIVLSLDADRYSKDQMIAFARSVQIDKNIQFDWGDEDAAAGAAAEKTGAGMDEAQMKDILTEKSGLSVIEMYYEDFDGDGIKEAFAEMGEESSLSENEQSIPSSFWFISGDCATCEAVVEDTNYWGEDSMAAPHILDFDTAKFITESEYYGGSGASTKLYGVRNERWYTVAEPCGMWIYQDLSGSRDFEITADAFDAVEDSENHITTGHTYKIYYFYFDGAFHEYGAHEMTEDEFLKYSGAADIMSDIRGSDSNVVVENILHRENGLIHINYSVESADGSMTEFFHTTVTISGDTATVTDDAGQPGTYQAYLFPDLN